MNISKSTKDINDITVTIDKEKIINCPFCNSSNIKNPINIIPV